MTSYAAELVFLMMAIAFYQIYQLVKTCREKLTEPEGLLDAARDLIRTIEDPNTPNLHIQGFRDAIIRQRSRELGEAINAGYLAAIPERDVASDTESEEPEESEPDSD